MRDDVNATKNFPLVANPGCPLNPSLMADFELENFELELLSKVPQN
jgi:hypothetical protein